MKTGFVYLVGAGPGDPELLTLKAVKAMAGADCIIYDFLSNSSLLSGYSCEKIYVGKKGNDHTLPQDDINKLLIRKAQEGKTVVRLKGGDPFIFGRGGEEAERLVNAGVPFSVIPGISSFYSAPAYAGIPLTHRDYANAFQVVTGHRRDDAAEGEDINFPEYDPDKTFVFLMGMKNLAYISSRLISQKGFPEGIPSAVISWGTTPQQQVVTAPLRDLAYMAEKEGAGSPAIILVGEVVELRKKLRWFDTLPLFGKKIAITRTRKQASRLSTELSALGASIIEFPTIEIMYEEDYSVLARAFLKIQEFDWVFFTSQNAVEIFFKELMESGLDTRALGNLKIAVIGPATGDELIKYGLKPDVVPVKYVAESLLDEMKKYDLKQKKILLPCSADARLVLAEGLRSQGALVERIHTYRTALPESVSPQDIDNVLKADLITFASSSTVRNFFSLLPSVAADIACIGPVTAGTCVEFEHKPSIVADEYTIHGLVSSILEFYK